MQFKNRIFSIVLATTVLFMGGCATSRGNHAEAIEQLSKVTDLESMFNANGLTEDSCKMLFPDMNSKQCYEEWHALSGIDEKLSYLKEKASPIMRGLWESSRKEGFRRGFYLAIKTANPNVTNAEVDQAVKEFESIDLHARISDCLSKIRSSADECILGMAQIASDDEISKAESYVLALYKTQEQAILERAPYQVMDQIRTQQSINRNMLHH